LLSCVINLIFGPRSCSCF